ncbi:MAG TPA: PPOX class F420-dependent oxidoreductase [Kribbella sp.]
MTVDLGEAARQLVDGVNTGVLATNNPDGSPQLSVVWVGRDGDDLLISTAADRQKDSNLRKDPRASLLVIDKASADRYAEIRGIATVTEDIGRVVAQQLAETYAGPGAGQEYVDLPPEIIRTVIRITPHKVILHV